MLKKVLHYSFILGPLIVVAQYFMPMESISRYLRITFEQTPFLGNLLGTFIEAFPVLLLGFLHSALSKKLMPLPLRIKTGLIVALLQSMIRFIPRCQALYKSRVYYYLFGLSWGKEVSSVLIVPLIIGLLVMIYLYIGSRLYLLIRKKVQE